MTARTLDAVALAARMNRRPLPEDCDGGEWFAGKAITCTFPCEACEAVICGPHVWSVGHAGSAMALHLRCAVADCERAEAAHRAADPHCTCTDCLAHHEANLLEGGKV